MILKILVKVKFIITSLKWLHPDVFFVRNMLLDDRVMACDRFSDFSDFILHMVDSSLHVIRSEIENFQGVRRRRRDLLNVWIQTWHGCKIWLLRLVCRIVVMLIEMNTFLSCCFALAFFLAIIRDLALTSTLFLDVVIMEGSLIF